jgi:hypothetical protein
VQLLASMEHDTSHLGKMEQAVVKFSEICREFRTSPDEPVNVTEVRSQKKIY